MHTLHTLSRDAMIIFKLGFLFAVFSDRGTQGTLLETYDGVEIAVTHSLLFLDDQSDYFFFEVKSCGKVNVTIFDESRTNSIKVALSRNINGSLPYACYLSSCAETSERFSTSDYCSEHKTFWVTRSLEETIARMYFGEGCIVGKDNLTWYPVSRMDSMYSDPPFNKMELSSNESATWKLGSSACQPDIATQTPPTTTTKTSPVQCPSGKNGGSSTSILSLTTTLLIFVSVNLLDL